MARPPQATAPVAVDVLVEAGPWGDRRRLARIARRAVAAASRPVASLLAPSAEVAVVFTDDARMAGLNARFRGKEAPTNVLSFPAAPPSAGAYGPLLGDIFLGFETIVGEAEERGLTADAHLTHLIVHGFLHLVGHDHQGESEAEVMEGLETAILAVLGIEDPYADSGDASRPER